jgi:hypothetical protein
LKTSLQRAFLFGSLTVSAKLQESYISSSSRFSCYNGFRTFRQLKQLLLAKIVKVLFISIHFKKLR